MIAWNSFKRRWVVWVWQHTPTCVEVTRLTSRSLEQPLTFKEWCKLRLHFVICVWCRRYFKQVRFIHHAPAHAADPLVMASARGLSAEGRKRIVQRLREANPS